MNKRIWGNDNYFKTAQGTLDHIIFLCLIITALLVMGNYIRNSLSGKWRETADTFGKGEVSSTELFVGKLKF
ncbi:MAG: hypothetical protein V2A64_06245 [Candidatus Omnitrophota bacterium]